MRRSIQAAREQLVEDRSEWSRRLGSHIAEWQGRCDREDLTLLSEMHQFAVRRAERDSLLAIEQLGAEEARRLLGTADPQALRWASHAALSLALLGRPRDAWDMLAPLMPLERPTTIPEIQWYWVLNHACALLVELREFGAALPRCRAYEDWAQRRGRRAFEAEYFLCRALVGAKQWLEARERIGGLLLYAESHAKGKRARAFAEELKQLLSECEGQ
ncbi:MAG: hypothetical protein U0271_37895 [Polyangiaceae bacterium]